jgi:uncharacterized protein (TIGR03437 family)
MRPHVFFLFILSACPMPVFEQEIPRGFNSAALVYGHVSRGFELNEGQTDSTVKFLVRRGRSVLFLTKDEAVLSDSSNGGPVRIRLRGGNPNSALSGEDLLPARTSYFNGGNPSGWRGSIPSYGRVLYRDVYPGIDMQYRTTSGGLEYDLLIAPGANPGTIRLQFDGATRLDLNSKGDLIVHTRRGEITQRKPVAYQEAGGKRVSVPSRYVIRGSREAGFVMGRYDKHKRLVIDPVLNYSSYIGGSATSAGLSIAVDAQGYAYVAGLTAALDFPSRGGPQPGFGGNTDVFVSKISPSGSALIYSAFLGGSGRDIANGIAVDAKGQSYITGATWSTDFPVQRAFQQALAGSSDAFVSVLSADGSSLVFSTYLGGSGGDSGQAIALDKFGHIDIAGATGSSDFPTLNALQAQPGGGMRDGFVSQFSVAGSMVFSTYLGGNAGDECRGIAADASGNVYVTGATWSSGFPTAHALQPVLNGSGASDAFLAKLNPGGSALVYSTYLGGSGQDLGNAVAVDAQGSAYVAGETSSPDFPVTGGIQNSLGGLGSADAFLAKLSPNGASLMYSTYMGGLGEDYATGIALDPAGNVLITGQTASSDFPVKGSVVGADQGLGDAFLASFQPSGVLNFSTLLGGALSDISRGVAVDLLGNAYVAGLTDSTDFPVFAAIQNTTQGDGDAFLAKFSAPPAAQALTSVSAAGYGPLLAPGAIASGFGTAFTATPQIATSLPLPLSLGGVTVQITDSLSVQRPAPLFAVTPTQVNFLIPDGVALGFSQVTLIGNGGPQATGNLRIAAVAPALFSANENGKGVAAAIAVVITGGTQATLPIFSSGPAGSRTAIPVDLGSTDTQVYLELYGSGVRGRASLADVQVAIGGVNYPALYAGPSSFAGLDQINVLLPHTLKGRGDTSIVVSIDGQDSNAVTVNIR